MKDDAFLHFVGCLDYNCTIRNSSLTRFYKCAVVKFIVGEVFGSIQSNLGPIGE